MSHRNTFVFLLLTAALSGACGGGSGSPASGDEPSPAGPAAPGGAKVPGAPAATGTSPAPSAPVTKTGALLFATAAPIAGVAYESGPHKGTTDAKGSFTYDDGASVRFSVGSVVLGSATGADVLSPYQLAGSAACEDTKALQTLVAQLEALDADATPSNGITVNAGATIPSLPALDAALRTFITAFDGEAWAAGTTDSFTAVDALVRGQGLASDGTSWFFSGTTGLEKTNGAFVSTKKSALAIPLVLAAQGSDHIGDIDVYGGTIYAPVEDKGYKAPKVVKYDATTLAAGTVFDIPHDLQTKGVPWIAVDGPRGLAYMAEWDPTPAINVFSLATMTFVRAIPLSTPTGRVQGGKVYEGQLYLTIDDAAKHVLKVHLATGTVLPLFALDLPDVELEGLAFFARPDGTLLHTLDVNAARNGVDLRHHKVTREPLRWKVCK